MAFTDFDSKTEAGFTTTIDPQTARRQLKVSLGLVGLMVVASLGTALKTNVSQLRGSADHMQQTVQLPEHARIMQASEPLNQTGG